MIRVILISTLLVFGFMANKSLAQKLNDTTELIDPIPYERTPEFPGGYDKLKIFFHSNLKKISGAKGKKVFISFVVEEDGSLTNFKIERGINQQADKEALRVIKLSPKWKPGTQNNKRVRVGYTIPVMFN